MKQFLLWENFRSAAQLLRYIAVFKIPKRKIYSITCDKGIYALIYKTTIKQQEKYSRKYRSDMTKGRIEGCIAEGTGRAEAIKECVNKYTEMIIDEYHLRTDLQIASIKKVEQKVLAKMVGGENA